MKIVSCTPEDLSVLREKLASAEEVGFDFETSSRHPSATAALEHDKLFAVGYGVGFKDGEKTYVPLQHEENYPLRDESLSLLRAFLTDPDKIIWAHNLKFEHQVARTLGITFRAKGRDSLLAQFLLGKSLPGGDGLKLKAAVREYLNHQMVELHDILPGLLRGHQVSAETMGPYCADDALQTLRLGEYWRPQLEELGMTKVFEDLECPFTEVLCHMREVGFSLNKPLLTDLHEKFMVDLQKYADEFYDLVQVPIGSNQKVSRRLFTELGWWPTEGIQQGKKGDYSVDSKTREFLERILPEGSEGYQALNLKSLHSKIAKLNSTYTSTLVDKADSFLDGRLRCEFNQAVTATGRLSSSNPNFQNIPRPGTPGEIIRRAFCEDDEGWIIVDADYSQADLVMMAHLSQDPMLLKAYRERIDLHGQTADNCDCNRPIGKALNLSLIYEASALSVAATLKTSVAIAKILHDKWHRLYPGVRSYQMRQHAYAKKYGYVKTITGRIRYLPDIDSRDGKKRSGAQREATNTPAQGGVSDVIKIAMRNLFREWRDRGVLYDYWTKKGKVKILSQIHDELVTSMSRDFVEEGSADLRRHLEQAVELRAPMTAEPGYGKTWLGAKGVTCSKCSDDHFNYDFSSEEIQRVCKKCGDAAPID